MGHGDYGLTMTTKHGEHRGKRGCKHKNGMYSVKRNRITFHCRGCRATGTIELPLSWLERFYPQIDNKQLQIPGSRSASTTGWT